MAGLVAVDLAVAWLVVEFVEPRLLVEMAEVDPKLDLAEVAEAEAEADQHLQAQVVEIDQQLDLVELLLQQEIDLLVLAMEGILVVHKQERKKPVIWYKWRKKYLNY